MATTRIKTRARPRTRGNPRRLMRVEVEIPTEDAELIRRAARSLRGKTATAAQLRVQLLSLLGAGKEPGLKALLAAAPLEDIDLTRSQDHERLVDL
ncbi:MAG: hypothetical protein ACT4PN_06730 [Nitrospiraceae bacterium]